MNPGKCVIRRFVFDAFAKTNLHKAKPPQNPTRVEAVTSLLCKCIVPVLKATFDSDKLFLLDHKVNLPRKPYYQMENLEWMASVSCKNEEAVELHGIVCKLREAIAKLNEDFMNSLQQGDRGLQNFIEVVKYEGETCAAASDKIMFSTLAVGVVTMGFIILILDGGSLLGQALWIILNLFIYLFLSILSFS